MKVIFSRKGFDSSYGGYSSPILPEGRLISLPIPSSGDVIKYTELKVDSKTTYYDLMSKLNPKIKYRKKQEPLTLNRECHLDPDICPNIIERKQGWKPCFGQDSQSQTHLSNQGVKENDLFLFFGWFRQTAEEGEYLHFDSSSPDLHVIFGYLQIGEILEVKNANNIPDWIKDHPHIKNPEKREKTVNTIYIARDCLTWDKNKPGAGAFLKFNDSLVLTKKDSSRSKWELPSFFREVNISRHSEKSWLSDGSVKSVDIGQEFVIEDNYKIEEWAKQIIDKNGQQLR